MTERDDDPIRELFDARLESALVEFRTELKAMAKALALAEQYPTAIDEAVGRLRELYDQRFSMMDKSLEARFAWMEKLLEEQRRADREARDKAEETLIQQLKQIEITYASRHETTRTLIDALKERMTLITGGLSGAASVWGWVVGLIGLVVAALAVGARVPW